MLTKRVGEALVAQIQKEGHSSNLYLAMASWAEAEGYAGISEWLYKQSEEEREHMLKIVHYVNDRGGRAIIPAFEQPEAEFPNIKILFEKVLSHEEYVSMAINEIVSVCISEGDFTTQGWIQWFVNEQIEEERAARLLLDKLRLLGDSNLYLFDRDIMSMRREKSVSEASE